MNKIDNKNVVGWFVQQTEKNPMGYNAFHEPKNLDFRLFLWVKTKDKLKAVFQALVRFPFCSIEDDVKHEYEVIDAREEAKELLEKKRYKRFKGWYNE